VATPLVLEPVDAPEGLAPEDVEELEELMELLLLEVYGALLLQGLLEVELESAFCDGRSGKPLSSDGGQRSERRQNERQTPKSQGLAVRCIDGCVGTYEERNQETWLLVEREKLLGGVAIAGMVRTLPLTREGVCGMCSGHL
jgi:hypothetical protein